MMTWYDYQVCTQAFLQPVSKPYQPYHSQALLQPAATPMAGQEKVSFLCVCGKPQTDLKNTIIEAVFVQHDDLCKAELRALAV